VVQVLLNHPEIDVNLCCCAFTDLGSYNYYTAYDVTMAKAHPHTAALMRARGVLRAIDDQVKRPTFDREHGRPLRESLNRLYDDLDVGNLHQMPDWENIARDGNPELAKALRDAAATLVATRTQSEEHRTRVFRGLLSEWHPDRHAADVGNNAGGDDSWRAACTRQQIATRVFQWLQAAKLWYFTNEPESENEVLQELLSGPSTGNERPTAPENASRYLHPSGTVFSVW